MLTPRIARAAGAVLVTLVLAAAAARTAHAFAAFPEFRDPHPAAGNNFGATVVPLKNGNVVITSPGDDLNATDAGAVYLFNGATGALLSTLRGGSAGDQLGSGGVVALPNANYLVCSPLFDNGATVDAGAVTFGFASVGAGNAVSTGNSLIGASASDAVGTFGTVSVLANGNYVVRTTFADIGAVINAGAVTMGSGTSGVFGLLSGVNSLVGSTADDRVGSGGIGVLPSGDFVVLSPSWSNGVATAAGAATFCSGAVAPTGAVSAANSLVGSNASDNVGSGGVKVLASGNYVVASPFWRNGTALDAGAVTFGSGALGVHGAVSSANSLVGSTTGDQVGLQVVALPNINYVVVSKFWDNGAIVDAGAVTLGNGASGIVGTISSVNSLVGSTANDRVGSDGVTALTNGNYVVASSFYDSGAIVDAGAVTFGSGTNGAKGTVAASISLVGGTASSFVGSGPIRALTNGNYVVLSSSFDNGAIANAGACTFGSGTAGVKGVVSLSNSLIGSTTNDFASAAVAALTNGNYVFSASGFDNGAIVDAGCAAFGNGTTGLKGSLSTANALVGQTANDRVGFLVTVLTNGNYVVLSPNCTVGGLAFAGAATWGNGVTGTAGAISAANSLVGAQFSDQIGSSAALALPNGNALILSPLFDNGTIGTAGAVTWFSGTGGTTGLASAANSVIGMSANDNVGIGPSFVGADGNPILVNRFFDYNGLVDAGSAVVIDAVNGASGTVFANQPIVGLSASNGFTLAAIDSVNLQFYLRSANEDGGHVRVGPQAPFAITSVTDIAADQGGWVSVTFSPHGSDHILSSVPVANYGIWRKVPGTIAQAAARLASDDEGGATNDATTLASLLASVPQGIEARVVNGHVLAANRADRGAAPGLSLPAGTWLLVASVPALQQNSYGAVVPTVSNAAPNDFVVTAHTTLPLAWFLGTIGTGQSVDNLAPAAPNAFAGAYNSGTTHLVWAANGEHDLSGYRLYRGATAAFTPSAANRIATPSGTTFDDPTAGAFVYKLTAVDVNGNESPVATAVPSGLAGVESGATAFALHGARPDPARGGAVHIAFALPDAAPATLELIDVSGRRIARRDVGALGAGEHRVDLSESRAIPAGLYWVRLTQSGHQKSVRIAVVE